MAFTVFDIETALGALDRSQTTSNLRLGDVTFSGMEVPSVLRVGGQQRLILHKLPGGDKLIDVAGNDANRIEMAGTFTGPSALSRAQGIQKMRQQGVPQQFIAPPLSVQAFIFDYAYDYTAKGAVIPYRLILEVQNPAANAAPITGKSLSALVGNDVGSAITTLSNTVASVSTTVQNYAGQLTSVLGQVAPIANIIGVGGPVASALNQLQVVNGLAQAGTDFSALPSAAAQAAGALQSAGGFINTALGQVGGNIAGINGSFSPGGMLALGPNNELQTALTTAGASVNRATRNLSAAAGATQPGPIVNDQAA